MPSRLQPGQFYGTELPDGVEVMTAGQFVNMCRNRPGFREAAMLAARADQNEDGSPMRFGHAALEVNSNTKAGRNLAVSDDQVERIKAEKRRLAYG